MPPLSAAPITAPAIRIFGVVPIAPPKFLASLLALQRRKVSRKHRLFEKLLRIIVPELTDVRITLDRRIDELAALFLDLANIHSESQIAVIVKSDRAARGLGNRHPPDRGD